ncbi:glycosyltransferase [Tardiphaga sp. 804_B3_N1_9]|uniref:glycosyltransferase n=1 Tax=Tardiphaga sp. 804_B3_N1_9 TaxID=3240786 RepID=UPI001586C510|nr:glycosyltransferase [Tardiphaga robiniae]
MATCARVDWRAIVIGSPVIALELIDDPAWMGGVLYLRNLAICLSRLPAGERPELRLLGPSSAVDRVAAEIGASVPAAGGMLGRILSRLMPQARGEQPVDLVYPGFGATVPGAVTLRWVPDFQHRHLPHLFGEAEIAARDEAIGAIAARPGPFVLSSETAAQDFARFFPGHHARPRVWRFRSLVDTTAPANPATLRKYGVPEKFLYLPNQFWVHKNHVMVFRALARLRAEGGPEIPLVCTGATADRRNEAHFGLLETLARESGIVPQLHLLGLIDRSEQLDVLRHAAAVIQPSLFEGWSTVVEDVRGIGRPIFLSGIPVHREQAPPRCTYFDPADDAALARLLGDAWDGLTSGPDHTAERRAAERLDELVLEAGRTFMSIATEMIDMKDSRGSP